MTRTEKPIAQAFLAYLQRAPEHEALTYYQGLLQDRLDAGESLFDGMQAILLALQQAAIANRELSNPLFATNVQFVTRLYESVLGREPDPDGLQYWVDALADSNVPRSLLTAQFLVAAEADERDAAAMGNRVEVALAFAKESNSGPDVLDEIEYDARTVLEGVDDSPESVADALKKLYENQVEPGPGPEPEPEPAPQPGPLTFTLTTDVDIFTGSRWDDTFNAPAVLNADEQRVPTLQDADVLDGRGGTDTLVADVSGVLGINPTLRNIEVLELTNSSHTLGGIDLSRATGVSTLQVADSQGLLVVANAGALSHVEVRNQSSDVLIVGISYASVSLALSDVDAGVALLSDSDNAEPMELLTVDIEASRVTLATSAQHLHVEANGDNILLIKEDAPLQSVVVTGSGDLSMRLDDQDGSTLTRLNGQVLSQLDLSGFTGDVEGILIDHANAAGFADAHIRFGEGDQEVRFQGALADGVTIQGTTQNGSWSMLGLDMAGYASIVNATDTWVEGISVVILTEAASGTFSWVPEILAFEHGILAGDTATVELTLESSYVVLNGDLIENDGQLVLQVGEDVALAEVQLAHVARTAEEDVTVELFTDAAELSVSARLGGEALSGSNASVNYALSVQDMGVEGGLSTLFLQGDQDIFFTHRPGDATVLTTIDASAHETGVALDLRAGGYMNVYASQGDDAIRIDTGAELFTVVTVKGFGVGDNIDALQLGSGREYDFLTWLPLRDDVSDAPLNTILEESLATMDVQIGGLVGLSFTYEDDLYLLAGEFVEDVVSVTLVSLVGLADQVGTIEPIESRTEGFTFFF